MQGREAAAGRFAVKKRTQQFFRAVGFDDSSARIGVDDSLDGIGETDEQGNWDDKIEIHIDKLPWLRLVTVDTGSVCSVAEESFATDSASDVSLCSMSGPTPRHEDILHADRKLVDAVLGGELGAFEQLVRKYQDLCWHVVDRMVRHPEDTRELCQDAFLRVHQMLHQYRGDSALKSWIAQVAYSVAKRHLERKRIPLADAADGEDGLSPAESVSDGFDLETETSDNEITAHLLVAIDKLPPLQRTLLTLYHLEEMQITEITQITGIAAGTIKSHLFRSRKQLRDLLGSRLGVIR